MSHQPNNVFAGTQVVSLVEVRGTNSSLVHPRGAVGVVTRTPAGEMEKHFLVRFPDGFEASLTRDQLDVLKHFKDRLVEVGRVTPYAPGSADGSQGTASPAFDLESLIIYRCVVGSRAYGLDTDDSDIVSHDVRKFFGLLLKKNGYVLEQLFSPLIVHTTSEHVELKKICCPHPQPLSHPMGEGGRGVITRHHSHHYFGFAEAQWKLFLKESPRRVKPLLYVYRVLLTGLHLMRTGVIEANLMTLNEEFRLPYIADLVARKLAGPEKSQLEDADIAFHEAEYQRLRSVLQAAHDATSLPELPSDETRAALNDLLLRVRLGKR